MPDWEVTHHPDVKDKLKKAFFAGLVEGAEAVVDDVQNDTEGHASPIDTGALRASYATEEDEETMTVLVGSEPTYTGLSHRQAVGVYAAPVEFGHHSRGGSWVPAQPHFTPAVETQRNKLEQRIADKVKAVG